MVLEALFTLPLASDENQLFSTILSSELRIARDGWNSSQELFRQKLSILMLFSKLFSFLFWYCSEHSFQTRKAHNMFIPSVRRPSSVSLSVCLSVLPGIKIWSTFLSEFKGSAEWTSYVLYSNPIYGVVLGSGLRGLKKLEVSWTVSKSSSKKIIKIQNVTLVYMVHDWDSCS